MLSPVEEIYASLDKLQGDNLLFLHTLQLPRSVSGIKIIIAKCFNPPTFVIIFLVSKLILDIRISCDYLGVLKLDFVFKIKSTLIECELLSTENSIH